MKNLFSTLIVLSLTACGSAQLVSTRYKPVKSGTVKLTTPGSGVRERANQLMANYCAPQNPGVIGTDRMNEIIGGASFANGAFAYDNQSNPLIHFECTDGPAKWIERETYDPRVSAH